MPLHKTFKASNEQISIGLNVTEETTSSTAFLFVNRWRLAARTNRLLRSAHNSLFCRTIGCAVIKTSSRVSIMVCVQMALHGMSKRSWPMVPTTTSIVLTKASGLRCKSTRVT